ncbi:MAG: Mur ligase family protein [Patescibacteria group bacterium]|jgi:UDP-N-acetylmuramoyl-L-alanyl-D-glutamate--2,6-diaminopimelate ligase
MQKLKNTYHLLQAIVANLWYGFPSRKLKVIGITGTDGKTTTTHLIVHILKFAGKKVSFVSSVFASIGGKESDIGFHVTTPSSFALQKLLKQSVDNGDEYFVLETTSHALDQNRVWGINYEIGLITNITHEHLDYHKNFKDYEKTKLKLLKISKFAIKNGNNIENIVKNIPDLTTFNQYNYSSAYAVCKQLGLSDETILKAMKTFHLPKGRLDLVYDKKFKIIIDFAHTPNALLQLLPAVRKLYLKGKGRLIHVFGSAGLRDFTKRPLMGEASDKFSDVIFITEEDYRIEDPKEISQQIASGIKNKDYLIVLDRQDAINKAIKFAKVGDVVVLTGKAHEKSLCRGKTEYEWDEYEAVEKALKTVKY